MKVAIFGAAGGIGHHAVQHSLDKGYEVVAYVRSSEKLVVENDNLQVVEGELHEYEKINQALKGCDAVIYTVGLPLKYSYPEMFSLAGHQTVIKAMKENNIRRFIDWSTPSISSDRDVKSFITVVPGFMASILFKKAKKELILIANLIKESDLDWTIVRFMAPKNTEFTGQVKAGFGDVKMSFNISRADIAYFMVNQLSDDQYINAMPIIGS